MLTMTEAPANKNNSVFPSVFLLRLRAIWNEVGFFLLLDKVWRFPLVKERKGAEEVQKSFTSLATSTWSWG